MLDASRHESSPCWVSCSGGVPRAVGMASESTSKCIYAHLDQAMAQWNVSIMFHYHPGAFFTAPGSVIHAQHSLEVD